MRMRRRRGRGGVQETEIIKSYCEKCGGTADYEGPHTA